MSEINTKLSFLRLSQEDNERALSIAKANKGILGNPKKYDEDDIFGGAYIYEMQIQEQLADKIKNTLTSEEIRSINLFDDLVYLDNDGASISLQLGYCEEANVPDFARISPDDLEEAIWDEELTKLSGSAKSSKRAKITRINKKYGFLLLGEVLDLLATYNSDNGDSNMDIKNKIKEINKNNENKETEELEAEDRYIELRAGDISALATKQEASGFEDFEVNMYGFTKAEALSADNDTRMALGGCIEAIQQIIEVAKAIDKEELVEAFKLLDGANAIKNHFPSLYEECKYDFTVSAINWDCSECHGAVVYCMYEINIELQKTVKKIIQ